MIFSQQQIEQVMEMVDFQHLHFCVYNVGTTFLSKADTVLLKKHGIDVKKEIFPTMPTSRKAFLFGKLAAILRGQTNKIDYKDFKNYLQRGQYIPLNRAQEDVLALLEQRLAASVMKNSNRMKQDIQSLFNERNLKWNMDESFKGLVKKEIRTATIENRSKQEVISEIGHKTGNWERDIGRIVETEMQDIYQYGRLSEMVDRAGENELKVYKNVFPGACRYCISLYLTAGVGSAPRIFQVGTLVANGTNIGRKQADWKAVIGTIHPHCRCEINDYREGDVWSEEKQAFVVPQSRIKESQEIEGKIVVTVGDKKIYV